MVKGIYEIYTETVKKALEDGIITRDEGKLLKSLRSSLGITESMHEKLEQGFRKGKEILIEDEDKELNLKDEIYPDMYAETYKNAVITALKDKKITQDEFRILDYLRQAFDISLEEHGKVEKEVRDELNKTYKVGVTDMVWDRFNYWIKTVNRKLDDAMKK